MIEASGSTVLESVANVYLLPPADGSLGPQLSYHGALVTPGQFGGWMPIAAERTPGGYEVAWKMGVDQYILWDVDSDGHWLSQGAVLSGASAALQSREPGFHQDLNGDGSIPSTTVIEASGSTVLESVASVYLLSAADGSLGPQLSYNGALVTPGQFGGWAPIAAERTPGGYEVAWKMGVDQYILWDTDSSGRWLSQSEVMSGASSALQTLEAAFQQDLNGDGSMLSRTVIEAFGSTALAQIANSYLLSSADGSLGPSLTFGGAAVTAWSVRRVDADRGGTGGQRLPGRLEDGRRSVRPVDHGQQRQLAGAGRARSCPQVCAAIARARIPPGYQQRRDDRPAHYGDRECLVRPPCPSSQTPIFCRARR